MKFSSVQESEIACVTAARTRGRSRSSYRLYMTRSKLEAMDEQPHPNHCLALPRKGRRPAFRSPRQAVLGIAHKGYLGFESRLLDAYNLKERELQSCREVGAASLTLTSSCNSAPTFLTENLSIRTQPCPLSTRLMSHRRLFFYKVYGTDLT